MNKEIFPIEDFDPQYLVTLDEIYHSLWVAKKKRRILILKDCVKKLWPQGHPTKLIHITGTNGKGSVAYYLEQFFPAKTGSWTGPHVFNYKERFHINGETVKEEEITKIYRDTLVPLQENLIRKNKDDALTFAELGILTALILFDKKEVEWGIMEVGAGGRYTQLMALDAQACILTNIGKDHPKTLGEEIWQKALEKAGIARQSKPFFTSAKEPGLSYVIKTAESQGAMVHVLNREEEKKYFKIFKGAEFKAKNIALAQKVIKYFYPNFSLQIEKEPQNLTARFWEYKEDIIVDIAHNENKINSLKQELTKKFPDKKFHFLLGLSRERNPLNVFKPIKEIALSITITNASYAGQEPKRVAEILKEEDFPCVQSFDNPKEALNTILQNKKEDDILVITGSAYTIDQTLNPNPFVKYLNKHFGRRGRSKNNTF